MNNSRLKSFFTYQCLINISKYFLNTVGGMYIFRLVYCSNLAQKNIMLQNGNSKKACLTD